MLDFDAICGVPEHLAILLFAFDAWLWRYLSWPDTLLEVIAFLWCLILTLFVVAGGTLGSHCLPSMLDFDAICGVPEHLAILLFAFDAWLWRYLSWPEVLLEVIAFLRCLTLTLFVVAGHTFGGHCFSSMLDFDAICRGRRYFCKSLFAFDAWLWRYLWCSRALGHFIVCIRCLTLTLFVVAGSTFRSHCFYSMLDFFVDALLRFVLLAKARAQLWFMKYTQHCANLVTCERIAMILSY